MMGILQACVLLSASYVLVVHCQLEPSYNLIGNVYAGGSCDLDHDSELTLTLFGPVGVIFAHDRNFFNNSKKIKLSFTKLFLTILINIY